MKQALALFMFTVFSSCLLWAQTAGKVKPVSVSYQNLRQCFPEIQDDQLSFKVDLNRLKEKVDARFVTTNSQMRQRKVQYLNSELQKHNLILRVKYLANGKKESVLSLQTVDEKDAVSEIALTPSQKLNPKQEVLNSFLLGAKILSDQTWHFDTKLNGMSATYQQNLKAVTDYELEDPKGNRHLTCQDQIDLGIICTCSK